MLGRGWGVIYASAVHRRYPTTSRKENKLKSVRQAKTETGRWVGRKENSKGGLKSRRKQNKMNQLLKARMVRTKK